MNRIFYMAMLLVTWLSFAPSYADDVVAKIGETDFATLQEAFDAVEEGQTITMLTNVTLSAPLNVELADKAVTLDLGDHTLTGRTNLKSGNLTLTHGNVAGGIEQALNVYGSSEPTEDYSVLTIGSDVNVTADVYGVCLFGATYSSNGYGAVVNINGTVTTTGDSKNGAVFVSGNLGQNISGDMHNVVNITRVVTSSTDAAVALNGNATVNVQNGAQITGNTGIAVKRGTLNVKGGTIVGNGANNPNPSANNNGTEMTGAGISMSSTYNQYGPMSVVITGGTVNSSNAQALFKQDGTYTNDATFSVSGGLFSHAVPEEFCAKGYAPADNGNGTFTVQKAAVAKIGDYKYASLADAIAAVPDGTQTTITMLDNETVADGTTLTIPANKNIVLDLNGKTISGSSSDSGNSFYFLTNRGTLEITDNSVGALGKITYGCSSPNTDYSKEYVTIYNIGGTLTLTEGTVENRSGYLSYAINNSSNAWGNNDDKETVFTMTGGCISAPSGDAALRVYQNCAQSNTPFSHNTVTISGGKIKDTGIFLDNYIYQPKANTTGDGILTSVTISGGEIHGLIDLKLRHAFNTSLTITGGTFVDSKLWVRKHGEWNSVVAEPNAPIVHISGGKFSFANNKAFGLAYDCGATSWTSYTQPYDVSGGVFNVDLNDFSGIAFPTGKTGVANTDSETSEAYPYTVGVAPVAQIGSTTYPSLAEAIEAATNDATITLLEDIVLAKDVHVTTSGENIYCVMVGGSYQYQVAAPQLSSLTIDGNGHTITMGADAAFGSQYRLQDGCAFFFGKYGSNYANTGTVEGNYTIQNVTFTGFDTEIIRSANATVNLVNCTFTGNHITKEVILTGNPGTGDGTNMLYAYQGALNVDGCTFTDNTVSNAKYGLIFSNNSNTAATITINNSLFKNNGTAQAPTGGNGLIYLSNAASSTDAITNNTFEGNYVQNASNNAAVVYLSKPVETFSGNLFKENHVNVTSSDKKEGVIVLGSGATGTPVNDNAFVGNVLDSDQPAKRATIVVGCNSDLSNNYWGDGEAPETGLGLDIYVDGEKTITNTDFASAYVANTESQGATVTLPVYVAKIGDNAKYTTLAAAIAAVANGEEIKMIANSNENVLYDVTSPNLMNKTVTISGAYTLTSPDGSFGFYFGDYDNGNRPETDKLNVSGITMAKSGGNYTTLFDGVTADLTNVTVNGDGNTALSYANGAVGTLTNVIVTNTGSHTQTWRNTALALQGIGSGTSKVTVKSGSYTSVNGYAVYMFSSGGTLNIEGGTFSGALMSQIDNNSYPGNQSIINISGGTFANCTLTESGGENAQIYVSGGTFSIDPTAYVLPGYAAVETVIDNTTWWKVGEVVTGDMTKQDGATATQATYTVETQVVDNTEGVLDDDYHTKTVTVTIANDESNIAEDAKLIDLNMNSVISKSLNKVPDSYNDINVEIAVVATAETPAVANTLVFEVHPEATVYVNSVEQGTVELANADLAQNATFTFKLPVADTFDNGTEVKVVHKSSDPATYPDETFYATVSDGKVTITVSHFSDFELSAVQQFSELEVELVDGTSYEECVGRPVTADVVVKSASYVREVRDNFCAWYVPFNYTLTPSDINDINFYRINLIANAVAGAEVTSTDQIWVYLTRMEAGQTLTANRPYVFKAKSGSWKQTFTTSGATLCAPATDVRLNNSTTAHNYDFYGTYETTQLSDNSSEHFFYVDSNGQMGYPGSYTIPVGPYRWYIKTTQKGGGAYYAPTFVFTDDSNVTGITDNLEVKTIDCYYDLKGMKIEKPSKGAYLVKFKDGTVKKVVK